MSCAVQDNPAHHSLPWTQFANPGRTTTSQISVHEERPASRDFSRSVSRQRRDIDRGVLSCDFRRLQMEEQDREREAEFKRFAASGLGSWRIEDGEGMCGGYAEMQEEARRHWLDDGSSSFIEQRNFETGHALFPMPQQRQHNADQLGFWTAFCHLEDTWNQSQTSAVSRLQQIHHHLIFPLKHILLSDRTNSNSNTHPNPSAHQITLFSCPDTSCHERLARLNAHLPPDQPSRPCPHSGCGYVSMNVEEWIRHCTESEHRHESDRALLSCTWCRNTEDTHAIWH